jgi:CRISPR-associated protein Cmr1
MPIRASAIRGQLRFWWRLLAKHKYGLSPEKLRAGEFDLWGGLGEKEPKASKVWVRVQNVSNLACSRWANYRLRDGREAGLPMPESWADAPYALFPAQGKAGQQPPASLACAGLKWKLKIAFDRNLDDERRKQVIEAMRWWASFGGVGARTRRGLGAVKVSGAGIEPIGEAEVKGAGCELRLLSPGKDATGCWQVAVKRLQEFRQGENIGRNPGSQGRPGRSRWPEPDAVRRRSKKNLLCHKPEHVAGDVFPRAAFGLPIIFQFKDKKKDRDNGRPEDFDPPDHTLQPISGDRMASPLILRPYWRDNQWYAAALLLPHLENLENLQLSLFETKNPNRSYEVSYWSSDKAKDVPTIRDNKGADALSAFMEFFVK